MSASTQDDALIFWEIPKPLGSLCDTFVKPLRSCYEDTIGEWLSRSLRKINSYVRKKERDSAFQKNIHNNLKTCSTLKTC